MNCNGVCPNCGYCPHCGRRNAQPWPYQAQPIWYYSPYQTWTAAPTMIGGGFQQGGLQGQAGLQNGAFNQ